MIRGCVLLLVVSVIGAVMLVSRSNLLAEDDGCAGGNNPYNRPDGSLIQGPGTPVFLMQDCQRLQIPHFEDLVSHRFLSPVAPVSINEATASNPGQLGYYLRAREGTILKSPSNYLYIIDELSPGSYVKRYITGTGWGVWFGPCFYSDSHFQSVSFDYLNTYPNAADVTASFRPDGMLIQSTSSPYPKYLVETFGKKRHITDPEADASYNFLQPTCQLSQAVINGIAEISPSLRAREGTLFDAGAGQPVYVMERTPSFTFLKRWVLSAESFGYYSMSVGAVQHWPAARVNGYTTSAHAHPFKSTFVDLWYKNLVANSLTMDRSYFSGIPPSDWDGAITAARNAWDSAPTTINFVDYGVIFADDRDIHVSVDFQSFAAAGMTVFYGTLGGSSCGDPPNCAGTTYRWVNVFLNQTTTPPNLRQRIVAHELGHAVTLAHDGVDPDADGDGVPEQDFQCGPPRVPATVLDFDCYLQSPFLAGPANWDSCGVNHAYVSNWGNSGC